MKNKIMDKIFEFYINSHDFNGISIFDLEREFKSEKIKSIIADLIREKKVTISIEENPYIKHFPEVSVETQLNRLETYSGIICVYPSPTYLKKNVDPNKYRDSPFTRELLLGKGQLEPLFFDLPVLDYYFNDPRYLVLNSDYRGSISIKDEFYFDEKLPEKDKISLQTFGLGFNEDGERVISVFLRYLSDLSPEHQQIWNTYKLTEKCYLDPDYFKNTILGEWAEYVSIYQAFCEELYQINEMCKLIGKPSLFKNDFKEKRPEDFKIFLKPTLKNYNEFIHILDKMLSENINKKFFKGEVDFDEEITRRDGKIEVRPKASIRIFEEWLRSKFRTDEDFYREIFDPIKDIRKQRQSPAHKISEDEYDKAYHQKQDEIMLLAYSSVKGIRLALSNHPHVKDYKVPDWLYEGKIRRYAKEELKMLKNVYTIIN
ncbi:MAG: AAA family ATPase [Methanobacteriaceae archaeon]|nr:AAA family ATPase [Methanobacteriaceae archaeon]